MISVTDLSYTYPTGSRPAVDGISFEVTPGEVFGFLGPSGAGKSTTQKVLIGLLHGYSGSARVLGHEMSEWEHGAYGRIGVSFELPNHFGKLTARENLEFFGALYARDVAPADEVLARVDLVDAADTRVGEFSKGMKNRLSVARAIQHRPDLLFLDEPTVGLDPVNARRVREIVRQERERGATLVVTTHDMVTADELCDRVAFIVDGKVACIDSPRQLKLQHGQRVVRVETRVDSDKQRHEFELDGLGSNEAFLSLLRAGNLETIHSQEATLEQVFVEVTGRTLS